MKAFRPVRLGSSGEVTGVGTVEIPLEVLTPDELKCIEFAQKICGVSSRRSSTYLICTKMVSHIGPHVAHLKGAAIFAWIRVGDLSIEDILDDLRSIHQATL